MGLLEKIVVLKGLLGGKGLFGSKIGFLLKIYVLTGFWAEKRLLVQEWGFEGKSMF